MGEVLNFKKRKNECIYHACKDGFFTPDDIEFSKLSPNEEQEIIEDVTRLKEALKEDYVYVSRILYDFADQMVCGADPLYTLNKILTGTHCLGENLKQDVLRRYAEVLRIAKEWQSIDGDIKKIEISRISKKISDCHINIYASGFSNVVGFGGKKIDRVRSKMMCELIDMSDYFGIIADEPYRVMLQIGFQDIWED